MSDTPIWEPCGHEPAQGASQLHGICLFCYRDRLAAERKRADDAAEKVGHWYHRYCEQCERAEQAEAALAAAQNREADLRLQLHELDSDYIKRTEELDAAQRDAERMRKALEHIKWITHKAHIAHIGALKKWARAVKKLELERETARRKRKGK